MLMFIFGLLFMLIVTAKQSRKQAMTNATKRCRQCGARYGTEAQYCGRCGRAFGPVLPHARELR
jgi:ribosomal protein L40E